MSRKIQLRSEQCVKACEQFAVNQAVSDESSNYQVTSPSHEEAVNRNNSESLPASSEVTVVVMNSESL